MWVRGSVQNHKSYNHIKASILKCTKWQNFDKALVDCITSFSIGTCFGQEIGKKSWLNSFNCRHWWMPPASSFSVSFSDHLSNAWWFNARVTQEGLDLSRAFSLNIMFLAIVRHWKIKADMILWNFGNISSYMEMKYLCMLRRGYIFVVICYKKNSMVSKSIIHRLIYETTAPDGLISVAILLPFGVR